jgi:hypothetical protein
MKSSRLLIWAVSINGEGSSRVSRDLIRSSSDVFCSNICIVTKGTILHRQLCSSDLSPSIRLIVLPGFVRLYGVQILLKSILPLFLFADLVLVLDDFPFLIPYRQVLYFHQPNLLYPQTPLWKLKAFVFAFLSLFRPRVSVQTKHVRDRLSLRYKYPLNRISVSYHAPVC